MSHDTRRLFESRHIQKYLDITKDRLHHWVQAKRLIRPAERGRGRGGRHKFSIDNLLYLAIIQQLNGFGFELNAIEEILLARTFFCLDPKNPLEGMGEDLAEGIIRRHKDLKETMMLQIFRVPLGHKYIFTGAVTKKEEIGKFNISGWGTLVRSVGIVDDKIERVEEWSTYLIINIETLISNLTFQIAKNDLIEKEDLREDLFETIGQLEAFVGRIKEEQTIVEEELFELKGG